ncbi:MAG: ferrochelatase [Acidobacteriota bacterium]
MRYDSIGGRHEHGEVDATGVLLANLGTPDEPTPAALRRYLREFLSDPRVIELPRPLWWLILNAFVLPFRPRRSARLYAKVWQPDGSPLLVISQRQAAAVASGLGEAIGSPLAVALGMRYGRPSIASALEELRRRRCRRILVVPLYPQYSAATTGSTFDAVARTLTGWRWVPELRTVNGYHDEPSYVAALVASVRDAWAGGGEPERLLFSFHGLPRRYFEAGDPYFCLCQKTSRLVLEALGWPAERAAVAFQSRFGREEWLQPYTDKTLEGWGRAGVRRVDVMCPGFAADCLETLEEIAMLNRSIFLAVGGVEYRYIPALNDRPDHVAALVAVIRRHLSGWVVGHDQWDGAAAAGEAAASNRRAKAMGAP